MLKWFFRHACENLLVLFVCFEFCMPVFCAFVLLVFMYQVSFWCCFRIDCLYHKVPGASMSVKFTVLMLAWEPISPYIDGQKRYEHLLLYIVVFIYSCVLCFVICLLL